MKPLQYFCSSLPMTWLMDERRLVFYRKGPFIATQLNSTRRRIEFSGVELCRYKRVLRLWYIVIRTLMSVFGVYFEYFGLCHKYQIPNPYCSVSYIKHAIWCEFVNCVARVIRLDVFAFIFLVL